jgi:predicted O-methyltransferase YrrM
MIRHARPRKIVEVGSGYSSCVILDTNEIFLNNTVNCTFIEPYPKRLFSLVKEDDKSHFELIEKNLQDVDLKQFQQLSNNDILFIDSTHVSKTNSDVNYILFKILPSLQPGVLIHFHDILYPFEYPKAWLYEGRAWNEAYILRSFLQYNSSFKIEFFNTFLEHFHSALFLEKMPLCMKNTGASIWLRKL